jgi:hypothetical protein
MTLAEFLFFCFDYGRNGHEYGSARSCNETAAREKDWRDKKWRDKKWRDNE